jgi:hypothetical protein
MTDDNTELPLFDDTEMQKAWDERPLRKQMEIWESVDPEGLTKAIWKVLDSIDPETDLSRMHTWLRALQDQARAGNKQAERIFERLARQE